MRLTLFIASAVLFRVGIVLAEPLRADPEASGSAQVAKRGLVTSAPCPFSCRTAGLAPENCRDWQSGSTCYVEDFLQAPGHRSAIPVDARTAKALRAVAKGGQGGENERMRRDATGTWITLTKGEAARAVTASTGASNRRGARGMITSAACPYSCRSAGLSNESCREWQEGESCFIEDYTQGPGHRALLPVK